MSDRQARENAREYFVPYILGNTPTSHRISARIFYKYGIVSLICDERSSPLCALDLSCRYIKLSPSNEPHIIAEQLLSLCEQQQYTLPIIIPVSPKYQRAVEAEISALEHKFVIADKDTLFSSSPLADIP